MPGAPARPVAGIVALLLAGVIEKRERAAPLEGPAPAMPQRVPSDAETRFRDGVVARHAAMKFGSFYDRLGIVLEHVLQEVEDYNPQLKALRARQAGASTTVKSARTAILGG